MFECLENVSHWGCKLSKSWTPTIGFVVTVWSLKTISRNTETETWWQLKLMASSFTWLRGHSGFVKSRRVVSNEKGSDTQKCFWSTLCASRPIVLTVTSCPFHMYKSLCVRARSLFSGADRTLEQLTTRRELVLCQVELFGNESRGTRSVRNGSHPTRVHTCPANLEFPPLEHLCVYTLEHSFSWEEKLRGNLSTAI